jgi:hypothetical protein
VTLSLTALEVCCDGAMSEQKRGILTFDWALVFAWLMATTSGWLFGWLLLPEVAPVTPGVGAGIMQSVVLVGRIPKAWRWMLATAIGWLAGRLIIIPISPAGMGLLSGVVMGAAAGTAQWLLLRDRVQWAGWWIAISTLAWAAGISLAPPVNLAALPPIVLSGIVSSVLTGITLALLLQTPKPTVEEEMDTD